MNVCALDVLTRTPDFESVAASLELRGWEWDLLHAADGEATLGDIARRLGIDSDSAIGFVHEAIHRGLLGVSTMSLKAYRLRTPMQTAIAAPSATLSITGSTAIPLPPSAPAPVSPQPEPTGSISFSSDAFDWSTPDADFDEGKDDVPPADEPAPPGKTVTAHVGGVHYDERFGVEHPDGPFASSRERAPVDEPEIASAIASAPTSGIGAVAAAAVAASAAAFAGAAAVATAAVTPESHAAAPAAPVVSDEPPHVDDPFARDVEPAAPPIADVVQPEHDEAATVAHGAPGEFLPVEDPFAAPLVEDPYAATSRAPVAALSHDDEEPFADVAYHDESFATATHEAESPFPEAVPHREPFAEVAHHDEPIVATMHDEPVHEEPVLPAANSAEIGDLQRSNGHATIESEQHEQSTPGSISFSFSPDDSFEPAEDDLETPGVSSPMSNSATAESEAPSFRDVPPMPSVAHEPAPVPVAAFPEPTTFEHHENAAAASDRSTSQTQSTYFEREAIDTDAARDMEQKAITWKESLSWREQQELNDAMETGKEKQSVIGSLLRSLGIR